MKTTPLLPIALLAALSTASPLISTPTPSPPSSTTPPNAGGITIIPINPSKTQLAAPKMTVTSIHNPGALFTVIETVTEGLRPRAPPASKTLRRAEFMLPTSGVSAVPKVTQSPASEPKGIDEMHHV